MANVDIPAWVARVQAYVASPPPDAPPLDKSFTRTMAVMEATKPEGLNLHTFPAMEAIEVIQAYYAAVDAAVPAGSGRTQKRKQKGLQKRRSSRRWRHRS